MKAFLKESERIHQGAHAVACLFLCAMAVLLLVYVYFPGLTGAFMLDDGVNLRALSAINGKLTWENLIAYLEAGDSGPAGRPVALLSFLINDFAWPTTAWSFKYTNILIHALNGCLVFWLSLLLVERTRGSSPAVNLLAGVLALVWLFNPYHLSTVLYVVQRMAMLAAFFVLLGLVLYVKARLKLEREPASRIAMALIALAYLVGAGLGTLAKENAALFVLMVPLVEWLFFMGRQPTPRDRPHVLLAISIGIPAILFILMMLVQWPSFTQKYLWFRDFTMGERVLSQARAVGYYLWRYIVPGTDYAGIYNDGFQKSTSIVSPVSTLVWIFIHVGIVAAAVRLRKTMPLVSFGALFFYVAHLMESSIVPLELFFEHRNYLPSAFLLLPVALVPAHRVIIPLLMVIVVLGGYLIRNEARSWGDAQQFHELQARKNPASERAAVYLAGWDMEQGNYGEAAERLRGYAQTRHLGLHGGLTLMWAACRANDIRNTDVGILLKSVDKYPGGADRLRVIERLSFAVKHRLCDGLTFEHLKQFLEAYRHAFQRPPVALQGYHGARAALELQSGNYSAFLTSGLRGMLVHPNVEYSLSFCKSVSDVLPGEDCPCLKRGEEIMSDGGADKPTLVRLFTGYSAKKTLMYRQAVADACR